MSGRDLLGARMALRVDAMHEDDARARATDAATHLRKAMDILEPVERSPELDRVAELLDDAATILIEKLGRRS